MGMLTFFSMDTLALFTHASGGTFVSIDSNRLVLERRKNGKPETTSFVLGPRTVRKGDLVVGALVSVHYRMENRQQIALSIQAHPAAAKNKSDFSNRAIKFF